jgi:hypothetical protein
MANLVLKAILGGDGSGFELMMKRAESSVHKLEHEMRGFAKEKVAELFGVVALEEGVRRAAEYAHKISTVAKQMGATTDEAQQLDYQMSETSGSIEAAATAFKKLKLAQQEVLRGSQEFRGYFGRFGISPEDASSSSAADLYKRIGGQLGAMPGELTPGQTEALQKLMGRGADQLVPSFKQGMPQLPQELIIPEQTIEKMHEYGSTWRKSGRGLLRFFSEATTILTEAYNAGISDPSAEGRARNREAREFLKNRFVRLFGGDDKDEFTDELEKKLEQKKKEHFIGPPVAPNNSIDVAGLNADQQSKAAESMKEVMDAAKILSTRGRPQIQKDIESINTLRMRAASIEDDGSNPANNAEAAALRFQAYQRVRGLLNPTPMGFNLNALESIGGDRIRTPLDSLTRANQRLVTVLQQLAAELQKSGITVPRHPYNDTNFR